MIVTRRFSLSLMLRFALPTAIRAGLWALIVYGLYAYANLTFLRIPFLPISTVGTAVAFYVGFKNNSAYERFWEGRKIWGGIVNSSRTWATYVISYVDPLNDTEEAKATRRELIYRQLAWINSLRIQLRSTSRFFHRPARVTRARLSRDEDHMRNNWDQEMAPFLDPDEQAATKAFANPASHMLKRQGQAIAALKQEKRVDLFHQIALMGVIEELYTLQGKCERIKNTPFPRQYAEYSRLFTDVFTVLVPFGLLEVFADNVEVAQSTTGMLLPIIPMLLSSILITWVFVSMEGIGDSSEDPFERSMNDVPMNALCRTIEIDLRQMLGETEVPEKEKPAGHVMY